MRLIWNTYGLFCGIILLISIGYRIPYLYELCLGGGSSWIILEVLFWNKQFVKVNEGEENDN